MVNLTSRISSIVVALAQRHSECDQYYIDHIDAASKGIKQIVYDWMLIFIDKPRHRFRCWFYAQLTKRQKIYYDSIWNIQLRLSTIQFIFRSPSLFVVSS
eukprot:112341_1